MKESKNILAESNIRKIVNEAIKNILSERRYETADDYYEAFYDNVLEANAALHSALTFCGKQMNSDPLVKQIRKAFKITNETAYYIEQRKKDKNI